jgi:L-amino acid N-acyltransferase YncA
VRWANLPLGAPPIIRIVSNGKDTVLVEPMTPEDWPSVRAIYLEGIATGIATFETDAPVWEKWNAGHIASCRLVVRLNDEVLGWAALSAVSSRRVYAGIAEVSVYVAATARGKGVGFRLLSELATTSEQAGIWTLQAGIFAENEASVRLHGRCGFRIVGRRERVAQLKGTWRDVLLMERRSKTVGV